MSDDPKYHPINRRNLLVHCYPARANDLWRWHLSQIEPHADQFNGRKIMAVGVDESTHSLETVRSAANRLKFDDIIATKNDSRLREVASFPLLLREVASKCCDEATLYLHTKGNSVSKNAEGIHLWVMAMYRALLMSPERVAQGLCSHTAVGCCKIVWPAGRHGPYPTQQPRVAKKYARLPGHWMFAGTFFWFRHDMIFSRPQWDIVADDRYAAEAWLSGLLEPSDGLSLYQPWSEDTYPAPSPYRATTHCRMDATEYFAQLSTTSKDATMPKKPRSSEVKRPVCHFHGPEIGQVKCSCPGSATVHACYHERVPSGKCCDTMPAQWIDGPIKLKDGTMTEERFVPFPFDQKSVDKGNQPWDNWVLCCDVCPHRTGPPEQVQSLYDQRAKLTGMIARYEGAGSLEDREAMVRDLGTA